MPRCLRQISLLAIFSIGLPCGLNCLPRPEDIPVRSIGHGLLVAPVSINGQGPFDFVIDTGTNTTLLDPALAARLGLSVDGFESLKTLAGPTLVPRYRATSIAVGSQRVHDLFALGQPMSAVQKLDKHINGILGLEFLAHFSFGLDYARLRLRLYAADAPLEVRGGERAPAQLIYQRLLLPVASPAAPQQFWRLALDSGTSQVVIFSDVQGCRVGEARARCREEEGGTAVYVATNQAKTLSRSIVLQSVAVGDLQFRNVPAVLLRVEGSASNLVVNGLLPACFFRSFFYDQATSTIIFNSD